MVVKIPGPSEDGDQPGEERTDPFTTLAGWRHFVDTDPAVFDPLDDQQWRSMSQPMRDVYDEARIAYHSELHLALFARTGSGSSFVVPTRWVTAGNEWGGVHRGRGVGPWCYRAISPAAVSRKPQASK